MAPLVFVADMGVHSRGDLKTVKKDLMTIPGVVEVCASLFTGHVAIVGTADADTLGGLLAAWLRMPVFLLADFGATPAPPVGGGSGKVPPPSPAPSSAFPAPTAGAGYGAMPPPPSSSAPGSRMPPPPVGGYYTPYVGYNPYVGYVQLRHAAPPPMEAVYRYTPFGGIPSKDEPARRGAMAPVVFGVDMGVLKRRSVKKIQNDLKDIAAVVEVSASLMTGLVAIIGMTDDAATLKACLETKLGKPAVLIADFGAAPFPPVGGWYGMVPPPWTAPTSSAFPAPPMVGGGYHPYGPLLAPPVGAFYNPYAGYHQLRYAAPPPQAGYYYTPFGGRPWEPHYACDDESADDTSDDEDRKEGCCCSIQ